MKIALAEVLQMVREELVKANDAAMTSQRPVMQFDECELEFAVDVELDATTKAKFLSFVSLGAGGKKTDSNTVRIKFKSLSNSGTVAFGSNLDVEGPKPGSRVSSKRKGGGR